MTNRVNSGEEAAKLRLPAAFDRELSSADFDELVAWHVAAEAEDVLRVAPTPEQADGDMIARPTPPVVSEES